MKEQGLPIDLSELGNAPDARAVREVVALPLKMAQRANQPTVFYLDELQRVADYSDGETFVLDLVDVYTNNEQNALVSVLVDGSDERALRLLDEEFNLSKLCSAYELGDFIHESEWRSGLADHFKRVGLKIETVALEELIHCADGRPYPTMLVAQQSAMNAREFGSDVVDGTAVRYAIEHKRGNLGG
ncbi:MAG TPA: hypothetical protein VGO31_10400 [Microbacteriaceae bacterium]|nr:hypothetical protein [Microbacteriaceae bacterium]